MIYDTWGQVIFVGSNKFAAWDGTGTRGRAQKAGMYYYVLTATTSNGYTKSYTGKVALTE